MTFGEAIAAALATCVAFLGALGAAIKLWPQPAANGDYGLLAEKIAEHERRLNQMDERINDAFDLLTDAAKSMASAQADIREALSRLDERRRK